VSDAQSYFDKVVEEHFGKFYDPKDWAEVLARRTVAVSLDQRDFFGGTEWTKEDHLAASLASQLASELRTLRRQADEAETIYVKGEVASARRKLREQFAAPDFLADFIREAAGALDGKGMSGEANALRDAATILETEF